MTITKENVRSIPAEISELANHLQGVALTGNEDGYAAETATWNLAVTQQPAVVVGAASVADVKAAVQFADRLDLPVAVTATGHGVVATAEGAVLINTRRMQSVQIDSTRRTARVEAGVEWQQVVAAAAEHGLAPLAGSSPNVGVVGYTLGGGLSPSLGRRYGFAADHVRAIEIVTADGQLRRVGPHTEPELFWALRGGKGNFGVVTALEFDLLPVARLFGGGLYFSAEHVGPVLSEFQRLAATAPDELTLSFAFLRLPPLPFVPEPLRGRFSLHIRVAYLGTSDEGTRLVSGLRDVAPALLDTVGEMPFTQIAAIHADPVEPVPAYEHSALLSGLPNEAIEALIAVAGPQVDLPVLVVEVRHLGGALGVAPTIPNAVSNRDAPFNLFLGSVGAPHDTQHIRVALDRVVDALAPWTTGGKLMNFLSTVDGPAQVATAFDPPTYRRLQQVKATYDPHNLFRLNHNIPPEQ